MHLEALDLVRLFTGASALAFASYTDWRWRRAPNILWWATAAVGLACLAAQLALDPSARAQLVYLGIAALFASLMVGFYHLGLLAGGADMKALVALAILLPYPLHLGALPLLPSILPPAFGVLGNALLLFLLYPLALMVRNLARGHAQWPFLFLGSKVPIEVARRAHYWPMEYVKDGQVKRMLMPSRFVWEDEDWDALLAAGKTEVWVTPKAPFMIPLLGGFIVLFFAGDLLGAGLFRLRGG